jgi:hypothetical protein
MPRAIGTTTPRFASGKIKAVMTTVDETAYRSRAISPRPEP